MIFFFIKVAYFSQNSFLQAMEDLVLGAAFSPIRRLSLASILILDK
jgi:hypothetical protein